MDDGPELPANSEQLFNSLVDAAGVPISDKERTNLRLAYATLMELAARTRKQGRQWEVRPLPFFVPKLPAAQDK